MADNRHLENGYIAIKLSKHTAKYIAVQRSILRRGNTTPIPDVVNVCALCILWSDLDGRK